LHETLIEKVRPNCGGWLSRLYLLDTGIPDLNETPSRFKDGEELERGGVPTTTQEGTIRRNARVDEEAVASANKTKRNREYPTQGADENNSVMVEEVMLDMVPFIPEQIVEGPQLKRSKVARKQQAVEGTPLPLSK
jgi:hypothetical protein